MLDAQRFGVDEEPCLSVRHLSKRFGAGCPHCLAHAAQLERNNEDKKLRQPRGLRGCRRPGVAVISAHVDAPVAAKACGVAAPSSCGGARESAVDHGEREVGPEDGPEVEAV